MTAVEVPEAAPPRRRGVLTDPAGWLTAAAGALLLAGLGVAVGGGAAVLSLALAAAGTGLGLAVLLPRALQALRRHPGLLAGGVLATLFLVVVLAGLVGGVYSTGSDLGWFGLRWLVALASRLFLPAVVVVAATGGVILLADGLRGRLGLGGARTPWQRLSGAAERTSATRPWRVLAGVGLVGLAALLGLGLLSAYAGSGDVLGVLLLLVVGGVALTLVAAPLLVAALARADRGRVRAAREDERQRVAAHLHDSVLQTLALVQRQAHDPAAVARLARRQEHALRAWMAGEAELGADTLGGALRAAVAEVEDEHGAVVHVTVLGERPLDRQGEALAGAAREALRNAARHAPGAAIYVFAHLGPRGAEAFVRDDGPGFERDAVAPERRGVRDAIVGRMAAVGGTAAVESAPGEGTEVTLRFGTPEGTA